LFIQLIDFNSGGRSGKRGIVAKNIPRAFCCAMPTEGRGGCTHPLLPHSGTKHIGSGASLEGVIRDLKKTELCTL